MRLAVWLLVFQGIYYGSTGLWPILHMPSFLMITGPKTDLWLVEMVGLLAASAGLYLLICAARRRVTFETLILIFAFGLSFMAIDLVYVFRGVLAWTYLLDAGLHAFLLVLWLGVGFRLMGRKEPRADEST